jgi:hypothetical protein
MTREAKMEIPRTRGIFDVPDENQEDWVNVADPAEIPDDELDYPDNSVKPEDEGDDEAAHNNPLYDFSDRVMKNPFDVEKSDG